MTAALPPAGLTWARWKLAALECSCCIPLAPLSPRRSTHTCAVVAAMRKSLVTVVTCRAFGRDVTFIKSEEVAKCRRNQAEV